MEKVLITATPAGVSARRREAVWQILSTRLPAQSGVLECVDAFAEDGWRYEVTVRPPATNLRQWLAGHQAGAGQIPTIVEQLGTALEALHAAGVVHLNVRPESIYVEEKGDGLRVFLGGLGAAVRCGQSPLDLTETDLFYAPPEAVDPAGLPADANLAPWDWWSVGRTMQELVAGHHVLSRLFDRDVVRAPTPALRAKAAALLRELEPAGLRAGAVEAMGPLEPRLETMLSGLLTTLPADRWDGATIRRWVQNEEVSHRYGRARGPRAFVWQGCALTLPEAVEFFRRDENWMDGEENICRPQNPATLAHYLASVTGQEPAGQKLGALVARLESGDWSGAPVVARCTATTALAWLELGPAPGELSVRGQRVDAAGLATLLGDTRHGNHCDVLVALAAPACLDLVKSADPVAAKLLTRVASVGGEALRRAEAAGWVDAGNSSSRAQVLRLALETDIALQKKADRVRKAFATNDDPDLARHLKSEDPEPWANLLLVLTAEDPRRFGYITKAEQARQRFTELQAESTQLHRAEFWLRVRQLLRTGGPCTGEWPVFASAWFGLVGFGAVVARDLVITFWLATGLAGLRRFLSWQVGTAVRRNDETARSWGWRDGPRRCSGEAEQACPGASARLLPEIVLRQDVIAGELERLAPAETNPRVRSAPLPGGLRWVLAGATLVCGLGAIRLLVGSGHAAAVAPDGSTGAHAARNSRPALPGLTPEIREKLSRGEYEVVDNGFGPVLHGPITRWDLSPPGAPTPLPVEAKMRATSSQRAIALVSAELLLKPYGRKAVNVLLVVHVPTRDRFGIMIYNARDRVLVDNDTLVVRDELPSRAWYKYQNRNVVYLGQPPEINREISLALR